MAIAYGSQGAGAGTETNGATLNLACPASVAANDILIAHTIFEGTANTPSTPSGWTLLYGPAPLGTGTPTARAWVFGKIADGSEDGATIGFGSHANTSGRYGRIYSFTGYSSGTITEICRSWSDRPTETTNFMPRVTTYSAGALAVALLVQDDNNTQAAAGAQTGGTWAEPVAEFVDTALGVQGCSVGIQTCTPTANPGSVSGGSGIGSASDEGSCIGFSIHDSKPFAGPIVNPFSADYAATSTPKAVTVAGCVAGDVLLVVAGGDESSGNAVTAVTTSTTSGSTSAWTEIAEDIGGGNEDWFHAAYATVSSSGDITVSVARTKSGTATEWGYNVYRCQNAGTPTSEATQVTNSSTEALSATVAADSAVVALFLDWTPAATGGVVPTPSDGYLLEAQGRANVATTQFWWEKQPSGTRSYGTTDNPGTALKGLVVEIPAGTSDQTITPTGNTVTVSAGSVSLQMAITATGASVSASPGSVSVAQGITPTATTISAAAGTLTVRREEQIAPTGNTVTVSAGTASLALSVGLSAPTVSATPGTLSLAQGITPAAATVSANPGSVQLDMAVTPTGAGVSVSPGSLSVSATGGQQDITATAPTITITAGTASLAMSIAPTGGAVSVAAGTVSLALSIAPSGGAVAVTPGSAGVAAEGGLSLSGASVNVSAGTLTLVNSQLITPAVVSVSVTPGSPTLDLRITPTGVGVGVTPGSANVARSIMANAATVTASPGGLTVSAGPVTIGPFSGSVAAQAGSLIISNPGIGSNVVVTVETGSSRYAVASGAERFGLATGSNRYGAGSGSDRYASGTGSGRHSVDTGDT